MTNHKKSVHRSGGEDSFCETSDGLFISSWVMQLPSSIMWFALRVTHSLLRRARHKEGLQKVKTEKGAGFPRNVPSDLSLPISILARGFLGTGEFFILPEGHGKLSSRMSLHRIWPCRKKPTTEKLFPRPFLRSCYWSGSICWFFFSPYYL